MDISQFTPDKPGRLIPVKGIRDADHTFLPALLPPNWEWPAELWPALLRAHRGLARLDGIGSHLPDPNLILRPLENREAQRSSQLEGTYATPRQLMLFEVDPVVPESADDPANAVREVINYGEALRVGLEMIREDTPFSQHLIRELHRYLLDDVRGSDSDPGAFRRVQVQFGRPPRFVPPPPLYLPERLENFEQFARRDERLYDPLVDAFVMHYQFEAIHPFEDGNGRIGRLLLALMITRWCELSNQWLYMSEYFDTNKEEYLERLLRVSTHNDWSGWIRFCLEGVAKQAMDTEQRCNRLLRLVALFKDRLQNSSRSARLQNIVDRLFIVPVVQTSTLAKKYGVTYHTARADIERLRQMGILKELSDASKKTYFAPEIIKVIYD
ncbi:MAG TPA: Fic family protein [Promineifilum sp.]